MSRNIGQLFIFKGLQFNSNLVLMFVFVFVSPLLSLPRLVLLLLIFIRLALEILVALGSAACSVVVDSVVVDSVVALTSGGFVADISFRSDIGVNVVVILIVVVIVAAIDFVVDDSIASSIRLVIGSRVELWDSKWQVSFISSNCNLFAICLIRSSTSSSSSYPLILNSCSAMLVAFNPNL